MNWLTNFVKPKLSALVKRKEVPENLWNNCPTCGNMIHHKDLKENLRVCISCNYHFRMSAEDRIKILFVNEEFNEIELDSINDDPLNFNDKKKYKDRLKEYRKKTNRNDAFILIEGTLGGMKIISGFMNFEFMGGSMGRAVGSAIVKGAKLAVEKKIPFIIFNISAIIYLLLIVVASHFSIVLLDHRHTEYNNHNNIVAFSCKRHLSYRKNIFYIQDMFF